MAGRFWTDTENDLIVADYFAMLKKDLAGRPYSKAEHNRRLQQLTGRSHGSIEYKHQNISAVLQGLGEVWIVGYKPASKFQQSLIAAVERWLGANRDFIDRPLISEASARLSDNAALWIGAPPSARNKPPSPERESIISIARKFDFSGRDQRNRELGKAGEALVLEHERRTLTDAGRGDLAKHVRWTSQEEGDGAGYDIASFTSDGRDRLIEVKTTNGWERSPFYISPNELKVARTRPQAWRLLRVWNYVREPKAFELRPPLESHVDLVPASFRVSFR